MEIVQIPIAEPQEVVAVEEGQTNERNKGAIKKVNKQQEAKKKNEPTVKKIPIRVKQYNGLQLSSAMIENGMEPDFKPAKIGPGMTVLVEIEKKEMMKILKNQNARGHSYLTENERLEVIVLKGINHNWLAEKVASEIKTKLEEMPGPIRSFDVARMKTYWSQKNGKFLDNLIVRAEDKETLNAIVGIKKLCQMRRPPLSMCGHCLMTTLSRLEQIWKINRRLLKCYKIFKI